jgi:hypothetical protein
MDVVIEPEDQPWLVAHHPDWPRDPGGRSDDTREAP